MASKEKKEHRRAGILSPSLYHSHYDGSHSVPLCSLPPLGKTEFSETLSQSIPFFKLPLLSIWSQNLKV